MVKKTGDFLFGNGWGVLIPYLVLYLPALYFSWPTSALKGAFQGVHGVTLVGAAAYLGSHRRGKGPWVLLFFFFLLPGAYLEYPGDPWEHVLRYFTWNEAPSPAQAAYPHRFNYFWGWTLLSWAPVQWLREALGVYSAFWQTLVCFQLYRLLRTLNVPRLENLACVLVFAVTFGTNIFGLRYYALGNFPMGYVLYLAALELLARTRCPLHRTLALGLGGLCAWVHLQEAFLFALFAPVVIALQEYPRLSEGGQRRARWALAGVFMGGLVLGPWLYSLRHLWVEHRGVETLSPLLTLNVWYRPLRHTDTLGVHGILSVLFALFYFRRQPLLASLTLWPLFLCFFPPFIYLLGFRLTEISDTYRLWYGFPSAVFLVLGLRYTLERFTRWDRRAALPAALGIALLLSLPDGPSWRGRFHFQVHRNDPLRALEPLDETVAWIEQQHYPSDCLLVGDDPTVFAISAFLGRPLFSYRGQYNWRLHPNYLPFDLNTTDKILEFTQAHPTCAVLALRRELWTSPPHSWITKESGHWGDWYGDIQWYTRKPYERAAEGLVARGWTKRELPPYHWIYEPPSPQKGN